MDEDEFGGFTPVSEEDFINSYMQTSPATTPEKLHAAIHKAREEFERGLSCDCCGRPMWVLGSAIAGWRSCYHRLRGHNKKNDAKELAEVLAARQSDTKKNGNQT